MIPYCSLFFVFCVGGVVFILRALFSAADFIHLLRKLWIFVENRCCIYQFYRIPQFNDVLQENRLHRQIAMYVSSLTSIEDSDFTELFSGKTSHDVVLRTGLNQCVQDSFLGARILWRNEEKAFVLKIKRKDKRRILRSYLQHIVSIAEEIEEQRKDVRLYTNMEIGTHRNGRWISVPFTHPATLETIAMDSTIKKNLKSDLESFLKSKQFYHRIGRVWKRSYLLYGPSGTGKSSFVAAMANFLSYDIYNFDFSRIAGDSDLKMLLLQTTARSVIVIEDLDRFLDDKTMPMSLSGVLNFMDGIESCCGEERVMIFTMNCKEHIDPSILRPGRIDVSVYFPLCDFSAFKTLANSYLGIKDHRFFPMVEENFKIGATLSPAEVSEIMILNRNSPSRALKSVINALQTSSDRRRGRENGRPVSEGSPESSTAEVTELGLVGCTKGVNPGIEFRKLYGLLKFKMGSKSGTLDPAHIIQEKKGDDPTQRLVGN